MANDGGFLFSAAESGVSSVRLHPLVLFNICDSYIRRTEDSGRVIGTLLGSVGSDGVVEIRSSFAVPHSETGDELALNIDYHRTLLQLNLQVSPQEIAVGWYSTGSGVTRSDAVIRKFYAVEAPTALHLTVDTTFTNGTAAIRAYTASALCLGDRELAVQFQEIPVELQTVEIERIGFHNLTKVGADKPPSDLEGIQMTLTKMQGLVDAAVTYVDDVVEGRRKPDAAIGRALSDAVAAVPRVSPEAFDKLFSTSVQDVLLVLYLANLTRVQLGVAEKLNTQAQQL